MVVSAQNQNKEAVANVLTSRHKPLPIIMF